MRRLIYVSLFVLWSSGLVYADGIAVKTTLAFSTISGYTSDKNVFEVKNMPRVRCQGEFPICYGMAASTLAQWQVCKDQNISDCKAVSPDKEISPLSMVGWSRKNVIECSKKNDKGKFIDEDGLEIPPGYCGTEKLAPAILSSYANIGLYGGAAPAAMLNSSRKFAFKTEACFPNDQIINSFGKTKETVNIFMEKIASLYNSKSKTEGCEACLAGLVEDANKLLGSNQVNAGLLKEALDKGTVQEFLYKLVFRDCPNLTILNKPNVKLYPARYALPGEKAAESLKDIADKAESLLKNGTPLLLNDICLARDKDNKCTDEHVVVLSGYKEACNSQGKCKKLFKVQNSWCADWQKANNDGWVDQESLLANISHQGPEGFARGLLSWYE